MVEPPTRPEPESRPPSLQLEGTPPDDTPAGGQTGNDPATPLTLSSLTGATVAEETTAPGPHRPAGETFGRYERLEELPRSGMGVVYRAWDPVLKIEVALKTMQADAGVERPELAERFDREARALALLDHPHIVRIYDTGRHKGQAYFTMGFMTGGSLDRQLGRFREPEAAAALVEKVARAMHYVHDQGILHRDLKPGNILLDDRGEPRVTDFGLAKFRDSEMELTRAGAVLGTLPYMAPEQASGQLDRIGPASDVWALGVILYELLTGRRPFEGKMREAVASLICTSEQPGPRTLCPGLDRKLEIITLKCLEKRPEGRYASAEELADDLARWRAGESIKATPPSPAERVRRFVRRHNAAVTAAVTAVLLLAGFGLLAPILARGRNADNEAERDRQRLQEVRAENLASIREALAREHTVPLLAADGMPRWSEPRAGSPGLFHGPDETLELRNVNMGALDLLPERPWDHYALSAEVRVGMVTSEHTSAGIYVAAIQWPGADGRPEQWFMNLAFPGRDPPADDVIARPGAARDQKAAVAGRNTLAVDFFEMRRCEVLERDQAFSGGVKQLLRRQMPFSDRVGLPPLPEPPLPAKPVRTWRRLRLEVGPRGISASSDGRPLGSISLADLEAVLRKPAGWRPESVTPPPAELLLRGSVGLYNYNANGVFRNVVVERLP